MRRSRWRHLTIYALLVASCATGCRGGGQRRYEAVETITTVPDVEQRLVLKNLARTVENPHSLPFYAIMTQNLTNLRKRAWADRGLLTIPYAFFDFLLDLAANRVTAGTLTTTPTNDPDRLELMRTAYQLSVVPGVVDAEAYDRLAEFLRRDPGTVVPSGWVGIAQSRHKIPRDAYIYARGSSTYAWVPDDSVNELTELTLLIQRIATVPATEIPKKLSGPK